MYIKSVCFFDFYEPHMYSENPLSLTPSLPEITSILNMSCGLKVYLFKPKSNLN